MQTYIKHSMDLKFNQIDSRMWNKSKIQNVHYKNMISILHAVFKYVIKFIIYSTGPLYNTLKQKMITRNLCIFPHSLFFN